MYQYYTSRFSSNFSLPYRQLRKQYSSIIIDYVHSFLLYHVLGNSCQVGRRNSRMCSVRYVLRHTAGDTGSGRFVKFGTIWIPVPPVPILTFIPIPDIRVKSVQL